MSCHDYPTAWDTKSDVAQRTAELQRAIERLPGRVFSPFSTKVWLASLDENEFVYGCLDWPRPAVTDPPFPRGTRFPRIPVLVLDGLLDQATPLADASKVARAWPDATFVRVANSNHITAQVDFLHCVSVIVRQFLGTRAAGATGCADHVPAQYVVPAFPASLRTAPQAIRAGRSDRSDRSTMRGRQAAWVATETIGDALERWFNLLGGPGFGLYGGSFKTSGGYYSYAPLVVRFRSDRFVPDVKVSGTAKWNRATSLLTAKLTLTGPGALKGDLGIAWHTNRAGAIAKERGKIGGHHVVLKMAAPFSAHG